MASLLFAVVLGGGEVSKWYYKVDGLEAGPLSVQEIREVVSLGIVGRDTPIRSETSDWTPAGNIKGLEFPEVKQFTPPAITPKRPEAKPKVKKQSFTLFDFGFEHFAAPAIIRTAWVLFVFLSVPVFVLGNVIQARTNPSTPAVVFGLLVSLIGLVVILFAVRVVLESCMVLFSINKHLKKMSDEQQA